MASIRGKQIDRNRYSKKYPIIRLPAKLSFVTENPLEIELGSISFNNESSGTLLFDVKFLDTTYTVSAIPRDTSGNANVVIFISDISTQSVTISASAKFTGIVDIIALRIG